MARIDMHVHTAYSEHPSEWFLQRIGARESYSRPEQAFSTALERGMDMVTITDHNRIDGAEILKEQYPGRVIVGVETTTYFPEDRCKVHLLIYGIDRERFRSIQQLRNNIYSLRDYLRAGCIAHSVAHATYAVNRKLTPDHLEKLILLFDCFEGINGARSLYFNTQWMDLLKNLTPTHIEELKSRHGIEPISSDPWNKAFTGGSDDHSGLFIGRTWTEAEASTPEEVVKALLSKRVTCDGRHNDYKNLAFGIYKIALDFARAKNGKSPGSLLFSISEELFGEARGTSDATILPLTVRSLGKRRSGRIGSLIRETVDSVKQIKPEHIDERFDLIYDKISDIADEFFKRILETVENDLTEGDISSFLMNVSSSLPGLFLSLPFLSALEHMYNNREIIGQMRERLSIPMARASRKILWFTDTISDLNGVAETLKDIARLSQKTGQTVRIVAARPEGTPASDLPSNILYVPTFHSLRLPVYENLSIHFPSLLRSIEMIYKEEPTEIFISTPGPVGLLGLLAARLLKLRCTGIYHTDFTMQLERITAESSLPDLVERGMKWFYSMTDTIKVPTEEYIQLLAERGYEPWKLQTIPKGIDPEIFKPDKQGAQKQLVRWGIEDGITLLYAGRISRDKNLDLLHDLYHELCKIRDDINLVVVGDGPYLEEFRSIMPEGRRIRFTGRMPREDLPSVYSAAHMFMFPSTTDTFGLVVLEAQACGLPAVVSDVGGPQEIISDGRTGFVVPHGDLHAWVDRTLDMIALIESNPLAYARMKRRSRLHAVSRHGHGRESFLEQVTGTSRPRERKPGRGSIRNKGHENRSHAAGAVKAIQAKVSLG